MKVESTEREANTEHGIQQEAELCCVNFMNIFTTVYRDANVAERMPSLFVQTPGTKPILTISDLRDEFEQFRIWTENIGVFASDNESLDYKLREASDVKEGIVSLLQSLHGDLEEASMLLLKDREYIEVPPVQISTMDSDDSDDSDEELLTEIQVTAVEIQYRLDHVSDLINKLRSLGRVIRVSGVRSRITQAARYIDYRNGTNQTKRFEDHLLHVLRHRYQLTDPLLSRLSNVISLRRRQFMYQTTHQKRLTYNTAVNYKLLHGDAVAKILSTADILPHVKRPSKPIEAPAQLLVPARQHRQAQNDITRSTDITALHELPQKRSASSTMVGSTAESAIDNTVIPPPPNLVHGATHLECPYCHLLLEQDKMDSHAWRQHVVNDLQPLVCIEPDCPEPYVVLETRTEWVEHHKWTHAMEWWCEGLEPDHPPTRFATAENYSEHLLHDHMPDLSICSLSTRVKAGGRPSQEPFKRCPFCDTDIGSPVQIHASESLIIANVRQKQLQDHIFNHLLEIFTLALPGRDDIKDAVSESTTNSEIIDPAAPEVIEKTRNGSILAVSPFEISSCFFPETYAKSGASMNNFKGDNDVPESNSRIEAASESDYSKDSNFSNQHTRRESLLPDTLPPVSFTPSRRVTGRELDATNDQDQVRLKLDLKVRVGPLSPDFKGFSAHARQLNPHLHQLLTDRIAIEQVRRYKRLLEIKTRHLKAVKIDKRCHSGAFCPGIGGGPALLPLRTIQDTDDTHAQFKTGIPREEDEVAAFRESVITKSLFPHGIPVPPVKRLPAEFECTLCFKVKKIKTSSDWIKHVYEDVRTYMCTFPMCPGPLYFGRRAEWVRHENERHRRLEYWKCTVQDCGEVYYLQNDFVQHLEREHKKPKLKAKFGGSSKSQLTQGEADYVAIWNAHIHKREAEEFSRLVEECRIDTNKKLTDEPCKFCGHVCSSWEMLNNHLGEHMEQIALPIVQLVMQREVSPDTIISPVDAQKSKTQGHAGDQWERWPDWG